MWGTVNITVLLKDTLNDVVDQWVIVHGGEGPGPSSADGYMYKTILKSDDPCAGYAISIQTEAGFDELLGIQFVYHGVSQLVDYEVIFAAIILSFVYVLIIFELIHRTLSAMLGSFITLGMLSILNKRWVIHGSEAPVRVALQCL